jgi:hypothetical protein
MLGAPIAWQAEDTHPIHALQVKYGAIRLFQGTADLLTDHLAPDRAGTCNVA